MKTAIIGAIETHSPTFKLLRLEGQGRLLLKNKNQLCFLPGQEIVVNVWGYGRKSFPLVSSPYEGRFCEIIVPNNDIISQALLQLSPGESIQIGQLQGQGFPLKEMLKKDLLLVADNSGLGACASLLTYLTKKRNLFGKIIFIYQLEEPPEIILKERLEEWKQSFNVVIATTLTVLEPEITLNPLIAKALLCVQPHLVRSVLERFVQPLGISYRDILPY